MKILQYTPDLLTPTTQFYNRLTANVPHCYTVKEKELAFALNGVTDQTDNVHGDLDSEMVLVAMQNGVVQAFVHVGYYQNGDDGDNIGVICFVGYERGMRNAGQTVLEKAETYLKTYNVSRIIAFSKIYRYRFYHFEYAHLSDRLDHVQALLGLNGYQRCNGQFFLDWENFTVLPTPPSLLVTLTVDWKQGRGKLPNCNITAHRDSEEVGVCWSVSGGEYSTHPDAQNWVYTDWIGVEDAFQGQGLGKFLLQYSLQEMHKVGYRHASLSTSWDNNLALLFYSNCGYKVVDWTYAFEKVLSETHTHKQ